MGHCGEFGYALWATALCGMKPYSKSVTISAPWAIAQVSVMRYEPQCRIFGYALWAIAQDFVMHYWP
jgi:hypothetical protein